jgi:hypothetical protein
MFSKKEKKHIKETYLAQTTCRVVWAPKNHHLPLLVCPIVLSHRVAVAVDDRYVLVKRKERKRKNIPGP